MNRLSLLLSYLSSLRWDAIALQLLLGAMGGGLAYAIGAPMPFLVGGLIATAAAAIWANGRGIFAQTFPVPVRRYFTAIIGTMIGQSFTPDLLASVAAYKVTLAGIAVFVVVAQGVGYLLFRVVGRYDPHTAFFAAMPGGLIEAVTYAEQYGADVRAISVQHFVRVILVVVLVPFGFLLWTGEAVGSGAGMALSSGQHDAGDLLLTLGVAAIGSVLGLRLRLPAGILIGPLALSALLQAFGVLDVHGPGWLLYLSQLVVGVGLGASFAGITRALLARAFALCALSVAAFLAIGVGFAVALHRVTGLDLPALIISFAPGGVTEMSLIALSLHLSPLIVAAHHVFRILMTVVLASVVVRGMGRGDLSKE